MVSIIKDNKKIYEFSEYWKPTSSNQYIKQKIELLLDIIPTDVKTILDVGCGNGAITNILSKTYNVTGVDGSKFALKHVKCQKKINASIKDLDLKSNSFDLVLCSEVLEHLSEDEFSGSLNKIKNLSRKYVLITAPNAETLRKRFVKCTKCGYEFNAYYHFRSLNKEVLKSLFKEYNLIFYTTCGKKYRYYNNTLAHIKQSFGNGWWETDEKFFCPRCENEEFIRLKPNFISPLCDILNKFYQLLFGRVSDYYWQVALFERKNDYTI